MDKNGVKDLHLFSGQRRKAKYYSKEFFGVLKDVNVLCNKNGRLTVNDLGRGVVKFLRNPPDAI